MAKLKQGICPLCARDTRLTFHHLIPRKMHRRAHFKKHYSKNQRNQGIDICRTCHDGIHQHYDEMTLAKQLNQLETLRSDPKLARYFNWVSKQRSR